MAFAKKKIEKTHSAIVDVTLEAPWYRFNKSMKALLALDPEVRVGDIYEYDRDGCQYAFDVEVFNHRKYVAVSQLLNDNVYRFGNINMCVFVYDEENEGINDEIDQYAAAFEGNPIVRDIRTVQDLSGALHHYVRFEPKVIQFFDDNLDDYNGNYSCLAQDIAKQVFEGKTSGNVHFCTADIRENRKTELRSGAIVAEGEE